MKHSTCDLRISTRLVWRRKNLSKFKHLQLKSSTINFNKTLTYNSSNTLISLCVMNNATPALTGSRTAINTKLSLIYSSLKIPSQFISYLITSFGVFQNLHRLMACWTTLAYLNKTTILKTVTNKPTTSVVFVATNHLL